MMENIEIFIEDEEPQLSSLIVESIIEKKLSPEGKIWEVVIIEGGLSKNKNFYPPEVLLDSVPKFDGARVYAYEFSGKHFDHLPFSAKEKAPQGSYARNLMGWLENVRYGEFFKAGEKQTGLLADFHVTDDWCRHTLLAAWNEGKPDLLGFSVDIEGITKKVQVGGEPIEKVEEITKVNSVDLVSHPAAGGELVRLIERRIRESM